MPLKRKDIEKSLENKGFQRKESHHAFFVYYTLGEGKKTDIRTKISHGSSSKDIGDNLIALMAKQCRISTSQFRELIRCPLDREGYEKILSENNEI